MLPIDKSRRRARWRLTLGNRINELFAAQPDDATL